MTASRCGTQADGGQCHKRAPPQFLATFQMAYRVGRSHRPEQIACPWAPWSAGMCCPRIRTWRGESTALHGGAQRPSPMAVGLPKTRCGQVAATATCDMNRPRSSVPLCPPFPDCFRPVSHLLTGGGRHHLTCTLTTNQATPALPPTRQVRRASGRTDAGACTCWQKRVEHN